MFLGTLVRGLVRSIQIVTEFELCVKQCVRSFTPKVVGVATRSSRNFGRSSPISTVSNQLEHTVVMPTFNWNASMCTTNKQQVVATLFVRSFQARQHRFGHIGAGNIE